MGRGKSAILKMSDADKALSAVEQKQDITISAPEFIRLNFQRLKNTGLSRRAVYENLKREGIELGTFEAFSKNWSRNEKITASKHSSSQERDEVDKRQDAASPAKAEKVEQKQEVKKPSERENEVKSDAKAPEEPKKKTNPGLRPIYAADGTELEITETGAKKFKITSAKNK